MSNNKLTVSGNSAAHRTTPAAKIAAPPKGYTRIWIDARSSIANGKDNQVNLPDADLERGLFARFGLRFETPADLELLKQRLQTGGENPFDYVTTSGDFRTPFRADGNYRIPVDVKNELYTKLSGKAAQIKQQIETEKKQKSLTGNPNEITAAKNGIDTTNFQRLVLENKLADKNNPSFANTTSVVNANKVENNSSQPSEIKLTLTSPKDLPLQDRVNGKLLRQTLDPNYDYVWGDKFPDYIAEAKQKGLKPEIISVAEDGENTNVTVKLSVQDVNILRQMNQDFQVTRTNIDQAREHADNYVNGAIGGFVQPVVNVVPNLYNGITEPFRAGEKLTFGTKYIPAMPRMEVAERSEYWNKDGRLYINKGAEITATVYFGGAVGSRILLTQTGRILTGAEAGYNIGAGLAGKDATQTDENGNYRQMPYYERGLRITGGIFGAKQTIDTEIAVPNSLTNKATDKSDAFLRTIKPIRKANLLAIIFDNTHRKFFSRR